MSSAEVMDRSSFTTLPPENFVYTPLPGEAFIRILTLNRSKNLNDPLKSSIEAIPLTEGAQYDALSYSWGMDGDGDATLNRILLINGKRKHITQNLYEGLLRLRSSESSEGDRRMWIDAICIDQHDQDEQSSQVAHMAKVYRYATRTVVWLGEGDDDLVDRNARAVFACFRSVGDTNHRTLRHVWRSHNGRTQNVCNLALHKTTTKYRSNRRRSIKRMPHRDTKSMRDIEVLNGAAKLFSRRYWSRRWIAQELRNSVLQTSQLYWGAYMCPLEDIFVFIPQIKRLREQDFNHFSRKSLDLGRLSTGECSPKYSWQRMSAFMGFFSGLNIIRNEPGIPRADTRLTMPDFLLLLTHQWMQCSDPRDLLYSMLSIAPDLGIMPDYTLSASGVFAQLARRLVEVGEVEFVLRYVVGRARQPQGLGLPSWVPNLGLQMGAYSGHVTKEDYNALNARVIDNDTLEIAPYFYGIITYLDIPNSNDWRSTRISLRSGAIIIQSSASAVNASAGCEMDSRGRSRLTRFAMIIEVPDTDGYATASIEAMKLARPSDLQLGDYWFASTNETVISPTASSPFLVMRPVTPAPLTFEQVGKLCLIDLNLGQDFRAVRMTIRIE